MSARYTPKTAGAVTATGNSRDFQSPDGVSRAVLVTTITGPPTGTTPSVTVKLQGKARSGVYYDLPSGAATAQTAAGTVVTAVPNITRVWRAVWTVSGTTPSLNLTVDVDTV